MPSTPQRRDPRTEGLTKKNNNNFLFFYPLQYFPFQAFIPPGQNTGFKMYLVISQQPSKCTIKFININFFQTPGPPAARAILKYLSDAARIFPISLIAFWHLVYNVNHCISSSPPKNPTFPQVRMLVGGDKFIMFATETNVKIIRNRSKSIRKVLFIYKCILVKMSNFTIYLVTFMRIL